MFDGIPEKDIVSTIQTITKIESNLYDIILYRIVVKSNHIGESREAEMDIKEAIKERHSVRQFQDIPVTEVDREKLIELIDACNAESGLH